MTASNASESDGSGNVHGGLVPTGRTALFTIIGSPVVQVVAPSIFNRIFAGCGHDAVLVAFDLRPGAVGAFFDAMRQTDNFRGGFVTVPHKQEAARHMDELMSRSSALGVVNVVKRVDGRLVGDMTDGSAFLVASRAHGLDPAGARVAMIGGGGTATAIAHACAEQGVAELVLSVRNRARHEELRRVVESVPAPPRLSFELDSLEGFDLVVNATTVGMNGDPDVPHPVDSLDPSSLVGEVVTLPRITPWIAAALERGCRVQYGADMSAAQLHLVGPWWGLDIPPVTAAEA
jgi:shikimate dehydrogenase